MTAPSTSYSVQITLYNYVYSSPLLGTVFFLQIHNKDFEMFIFRPIQTQRV